MTEQQHDQVAATGTPADTSARAEGASDEPQAAGKGRAKKLTLLALKLAFTGAMLYVIFGKVLARDGAEDLSARLANLDWRWVVAAVCMQLTAIGFATVRWQRLLVGQGIHAPWRFLGSSIMIARFWGAFTPGGFTGFGGWRIFDIAERTDKTARAAAVIGVEMILGQLAFGVVVMMASVFGAEFIGMNGVLLINAAFVTIITIGITFLARPRLFRTVSGVLPGNVQARIHTLIDAVCAYQGKGLLVAQAAALGVGVHAFNNLIYVCAARALGVELSVGQVFFASSLQILATLIPASINGMGLRETAAVALYTSPAIGLPLAVAVLIPTVGFACEMFVSAWGGLAFLLRKGGVRADITVDESEREEQFYAETGVDESRWSVPKRGLILGFGAGLLAGVLIGLAEGSVIVATSAVPTGLNAIVYGAVSYAVLCSLLGAVGGFVMAHVSRMMRREAMPEADAYARYCGAIVGLFGFVLSAFLVRRDVYDEEIAYKSKEGLLLLGSAALFGLVLYVVLSASLRFLLKKQVATPVLGIRGSLGLFVGLVALLMGITFAVGKPAIASDHQNRATPPADAGNVLVIVVDTLRADHLPAWGYQRGSTPHLDAFAADAVRFDQAFSNASWTRPSFASIMSGRMPSSHTVMGKGSRLPEEVTTMAEAMSARGFVTGGFVTNFNVEPRFNFGQGFDEYRFLEPDFVLGADADSSKLLVLQVVRRVREKFNGMLNVVAPGADYQDAETVNRELFAWLERAPSDRPWLLFAGYMDPHDPYFSHPYSGSGYSRAAHQNPRPEEAEALRRLYDGEITYWDSHFGALVAELQRRGLYDDMTIIVTSDHGEEFGEHGGFWHGDTLYDEQLRVPLMVKLPRNSRGGTVLRHWVQSIDIMPTLLRAQGLDVPEGVQGGDLFLGTDRVYAEESHAENILESIRVRSGMTERKLITANEGNPRGLPTTELFHVDDDPTEQHDRAADADSAEEIAGLRTLMAERRRWAAEGRAQSDEVPVTDMGDDEKASLCRLGYLTGEVCLDLCRRDLLSGALCNATP
ncbi:MAG: sulfatase-like hydrolase/transferase [Sandaracinaceae bacterium]|nr:sulfatase-like hydrolase/transferase [Sandaracinaceae bacterium]